MQSTGSGSSNPQISSSTGVLESRVSGIKSELRNIKIDNEETQVGSPKVNLNNLLHYLTEAEVNYLKQQSGLLLIADGYDEIPGQQSVNLYDINQFNKYNGRIKLLISCRTERVYQLDDATHFKPHKNDGSLDESQFMKRTVAAFTDAQIKDYIIKYLAENKNRTDIVLWSDVENYLKQFTSFPELKKLIQKHS